MISTPAVWELVWWLVGVLALWLVVSIPAYAVLTVWLMLREALATAIVSVHQFAERVLQNQIQSEKDIEERLRLRARWYEVDATAKQAWLQTIEAISLGAKANATRVADATSTCSSGLKLLAPIGKQLRKLGLTADNVPTIPDGDQFLDTSTRARVALVTFIVSSFLLIAMILVNAQMTGLVLSEIIPPLQPFFNIPVPFLIAMGLVLMEAGIGLLHAVDAESREGTERSFTVGAMIWSTAGAGVVLVESLLYGQVDAGAVLQIPLAGSVFGLIGGLLGLAVFGLGRVWFSSITTIRKSRTPRLVRRELERLRHAADEWNAVAERLRPQHEQTANAFEQLISLCREGSEIQVQAVRKLDAELNRHRVDVPPWARPQERAFSEHEFSERVSRITLWLLLWMIAAVVVVAISASFAIWVSPTAGMSMGAGLVIGSAALGLLAAQTSVTTPRSRITLQLALAFTAILLAFLDARFLRGRLVGWHGVALTAPTLAAFVAGLKIGPDVGLLRVPLLVVIRMAKILFCFGALLLVRLVAVVAAVIEYGLRILAWPLWTAVQSYRSRRTNLRVAA